jgi:hypothetical protein
MSVSRLIEQSVSRETSFPPVGTETLARRYRYQVAVARLRDPDPTEWRALGDYLASIAASADVSAACLTDRIGAPVAHQRFGLAVDVLPATPAALSPPSDVQC